MKRLLLSCALLLPLGVLAESYSCRPTVKQVCTPEGCERQTEDFQHAEHFTYDSRSARLTACLWTACYEGRATPLRDGATLTVFGRLKVPAGDDGRAAESRRAMVVSLTLDEKRRFLAVWGYAGTGMTADMGVCEVEPVAPAK